MKELIIIGLIASCTLFYGRVQYIRGLHEAKFDMAVANAKIQKCNEVITNYRLTLEH